MVRQTVELAIPPALRSRREPRPRLVPHKAAIGAMQRSDLNATKKQGHTARLMRPRR
jgi:hypothetical protein